MSRVLLAGFLLAIAGCQTQNPFAAIGPATVPAPATGQQLPYYPAMGTTASSASATNSAGSPALASGRISVSADGAPQLPTATSAIVAEAADREPIRIVEGSSPAIRTADVPNRGAASRNSAVPSASRIPASQPAGQPSSRIQPQTSPATGRVRGFAAASAPAGADVSRAVVPAGYEQPAPTFAEITDAGGQWRAR